MKQDILKIAGVKSEKEFYKKYPTEEAFMKVHGKAFKKAAMGKSMVKKQLTQLTDFTNPPQAYVGEVIPGIPSQYQIQTYNPNPNPYSGNTLNTVTYNGQTGMVNSNTGQVSMADTQKLGFNNSGTKSINRTIKDLDANDIQSGFQATSTIGQNVQKVSQAIQQKKKAKQLRALAPVIEQASETRPEISKNRYVRDVVGLSGGVGTGADFLQMKNGGPLIGGNDTEIQNMYNPGDIYSDMGYEPLDDSSNVKQFEGGGSIGGVPLNLIQEGVNLGGDIVAGIINMGTKRLNKQSTNILNQAGFQSGMQDVQQNQYGANMEDGGDLKYLSHNWQPQLITKFGDYDVEDLLAPPKDADMLRTGGSLKHSKDLTQRALQTNALGGQLKTTWGGYAEPISQNPHLPGSGETVMFRGKSHDESDGNGHTGIGVKYGQGAHDSYTNYAEYGTEQADADVEVERGEPAVELPDSETGDLSMIVFGNMKIPSYGVSELGDNKAKGKKFKHYAADLSKIEKKAEKTKDKALKIIDDVDGDTPFDILKLNTGKIMLQGADATYGKVASKKKLLADIQNAILDTAEEMGLESDALAKNKIKPAKDSDMAKFGAKLETAQKGKNKKKTPPKEEYYETKRDLVPLMGRTPKIDLSYPKEIDAEFLKAHPVPSSIPFNSLPEKKTLFEQGLEAYEKLYPYIRPGIRNPLDPEQLYGEMYALATNRLEPVGAQQITPMLEEVPTISFQDQLNEIQAQTNAAMRLAGGNPAAQSMIASQASAAKNKVLAEQFRTNQAIQTESRLRNIATLKDTTIKNLGLIDQQQQRQAQAKSATKAQAQEALSSIAEKIGKNKSETLAANVMGNMYPQFSYGPQGRIYSTGTTKFNTGTVADYTPDELKVIAEAKNIQESKKKKRNGSIVKAIKNL